MASEAQPQRKVVLCLQGFHNTHKENKRGSPLALAKGASPRGVEVRSSGPSLGHSESSGWGLP